MNCRHCGHKIGLIERWRYEHFCSKECRGQFEEESARLSLEVLTHRTGAAAATKQPETPAPAPAASGSKAPQPSGAGSAPAKNEPPDPVEAPFLAQMQPSTADAPIGVAGFEKALAPPAGRKEKNKGKEWPKFPESSMPEHVALERERHHQKRALRLSVGLLQPAVLDHYWWPELLPVFSPEVEYCREFTGMEAAWSVPMPPDERVLMARPEDLPGRSRLEWAPMETVTEVPPLLLAGANVYLRGGAIEALDDTLEQVSFETEGWRCVDYGVDTTAWDAAEPDLPALGVPLAPIEVRPHPASGGGVARGVPGATGMAPSPASHPGKGTQGAGGAASWGTMMRQALESAALGGATAGHGQQGYPSAPAAPAVAPLTPGPVAAAPPLTIGASAFHGPIELTPGVRIQLVPNPGSFLTEPLPGARKGGSDQAAGAAPSPEQTQPNPVVDPVPVFALPATHCAEAGIEALVPTEDVRTSGSSDLHTAAPSPLDAASVVGLPGFGTPGAFDPDDWQGRTATTASSTGEPPVLDTTTSIRQMEIRRLDPAPPPAEGPRHRPVIQPRGFCYRTLVLNWTVQARSRREWKLPEAASRARLPVDGKAA